MADLKVSQLATVSSLAGTDLLYAVASSLSKAISITNFFQYDELESFITKWLS
jgi:hypothetical protein